MATNTEKPRLRVRPQMSLEQAMAEIRKYLQAMPAAAESRVTVTRRGANEHQSSSDKPETSQLPSTT
jgi:hypothetical protein